MGHAIYQYAENTMNTFDDYINEMQGFRSRKDRIRDYFDERRIDIVINFMRSAYEQGCEDSKEYSNVDE
jgi:hypothetical protein